MIKSHMITIPRDAIKVLWVQAILSEVMMDHVDAREMIAMAKETMVRDLAHKLMEHVTFEVREIDLGTHFRVKINLIEEVGDP